MGSGCKVHRNLKNMLNIPLNVTNSVLFREKNFHRCNFGGGHVPLSPPFPAPLFVRRLETASMVRTSSRINILQNVKVVNDDSNKAIWSTTCIPERRK